VGKEALYRRPRTTKPEPGHKIYPYLLRGMEITRPNQVWAMDITYIPYDWPFLCWLAARSSEAGARSPTHAPGAARIYAWCWRVAFATFSHQ
jgi:transposase InsO family protein